jgi:hypothetical protein
LNVSISETSPNRKPINPSRFRLLQRLYPLPRPLLTIEEWERSRHLDLAGLSIDDLELEGHRVRHRIAYDPKPHPWLLERRERVRCELRRVRQ